MDEIEDPTIKQPHCAECGLPIRSQSFEVHKPHIPYTVKGKGGIIRSGAEGVEQPKEFAPAIWAHTSGGWVHDDPRGVRDHNIEPQYFGPKHTHATDYERQLRNWNMEQMEARSHLGKQFQRPETE